MECVGCRQARLGADSGGVFPSCQVNYSRLPPNIVTARREERREKRNGRREERGTATAGTCEALTSHFSLLSPRFSSLLAIGLAHAARRPEVVDHGATAPRATALEGLADSFAHSSILSPSQPNGDVHGAEVAVTGGAEVGVTSTGGLDVGVGFSLGGSSVGRGVAVGGFDLPEDDL